MATNSRVTGAVAVDSTEPLVLAACQRLLGDFEGLSERVVSRIRAAEPVYLTDVTRAQLMDSVRPNLRGLVETLMQDEPVSVAAPRRTGRTRAAQGVALAPVLHAYRLGALTIWDELVELCGDDPAAARALLASAHRLWTGLDVYSQELSAAYRDLETELLRRDARQREAALAAVLSGSAPPGRTLAEMADALRLPAAGPFAVLVGAVSLERPLAAIGVRSYWRAEGETEIGLVVLARGQGPEQALEQVVEQLTLAEGRTGVSRPVTALADVPLALAQARLAREAAAGEGPSRFEDARLAGLLLGSSLLADDLRADVLDGLDGLPGADVERLLATFRGWVAADGSAERAGALLHCHPNTVRYRLGRLGALTGRDLRRPLDVVHLVLAAEAHRLAGEAPATG